MFPSVSPPSLSLSLSLSSLSVFAYVSDCPSLCAYVSDFVCFFSLCACVSDSLFTRCYMKYVSCNQGGLVPVKKAYSMKGVTRYYGQAAKCQESLEKTLLGSFKLNGQF